MNREKPGKKKPFPKKNANFFSLLTFSYLVKFIQKGRNKELEEDDLYEISSVLQSKILGDKLEKRWNTETNKNNGRIIDSIASCFGITLMLLFVGQLIVRLIYLHFFPKAVGMFVSYFDSNQTKVTKNLAFRYAGNLVLLMFLNGLWNEHYELWKMELALKIQISLSSLLYRKILRLSENKINEISSGKIVTVIMKDVLLFGETVMFGIEFFSEIFHVILVCYLLYGNIGIGSSAGVGVMIISLIIQISISSIIHFKRSECNKNTDCRLHQTEEILSFVKCIKILKWESLFTDKITEMRKNELSYLQSLNVWKSFTIAVGTVSGSIAQISIFSLCTYLGNPLNADLVYYVQQLLQRVIVNTIYISTGVKTIPALIVAVNRIDIILNTEESDLDCKKNIQITKPMVARVGDRILQSGLNILIGRTGSGKSTLLKAIISENIDNNNTSFIPRKLCYASQTPWLFPSSVKQNILFGELYNEEKYTNVINACSLAHDMNTLANGDETILTDRGSNLSQGQKMRINLARALYKDGDIYLLDDCLASLDVRTENHVFSHAISKFLRGKMCLLVTHRSKFLKKADNVIIMQDKTIKYIGKFIDIAPELFQQTEDNKNYTIDEIDYQHENEENPVDNAESNEATMLLYKKNKFENKNVYSEKKKTGRVNFNCYKSYFKFGGGLSMVMNLIGLHVICEASSGIGQKLLSSWVNNFVTNTTNGTICFDDSSAKTSIESFINSSRRIGDAQRIPTRDQTKLSEFIAVDAFTLYVVAIVVSTVFIILRYIMNYYYCTKVSRNIHKSMLTNILQGSMIFFDTHMIGNILTRFSKDLFNIDEVIPFFLVDGMKLLFYLPSCLLLISSVNITFGILGVALIFTYSLLCDYVLSTTRCLQRISTSTLSPIIGRINTSLEGVTIIRAHGRQEILRNEFDRYLDTNFSAQHSCWIALKFFSFCLQCLGSIFLLLCTLILLHIETGLLAGDVGLVIYQSTLLYILLYHFLVSVLITENLMTSTERALEYTNIPQESQSGQELELWPHKGGIEFQNVSLTYKTNNKIILKNLNFKICPHEKIGIVGRTGAGKSSIISVLMRMYDFVGNIMIDNINIKTLSLACLRTNINVIPQEPFIFIGTIRANIDPMLKMSDAQLWKTLEEVNLKSYFECLDEDIEKKKLSVGQKQLICLGRSLAKQNKIIILDEATANMDEEMDLFVQDRLSEMFKLSTVIIVAHRLHTVMKCDKIIVLDKGEIVEFDTPHNLLRNTNSLFFEMMNQKTDV